MVNAVIARRPKADEAIPFLRFTSSTGPFRNTVSFVGSPRPLRGLAMTVLAVTILVAAPAAARVHLGIDVLQDEDFAPIQGLRVALITNHTGVDSRGQSTVDILHEASEVDLVRILTPEHGFRGDAEHGRSVADSTDPATGLPVFSLYGATKRPTDAMLEDVDAVVFDIQDIGTRFYTYITTMAMALEEAARRDLLFVVLDRPNPIRGDIVEGDVLDSDIRRMTGYFEIPTRHGLTVGELAHWTNDNRALGARLKVVPLRKWKRNLWFSQTGLDFVPPSPNIPNLASAILYPGVGAFEATNVSVGRGTDTPFEVFGAPWMDARALCAHLREMNLPGFVFEPARFTPAKDLYRGQDCEGVRVIVTNRNKAMPFEMFVRAFLFLAENHPDAFKPEWEEVRVVTGSRKLREAAEGRLPVEELLRLYHEAAERFRASVAGSYLY